MLFLFIRIKFSSYLLTKAALSLGDEDGIEAATATTLLLRSQNSNLILYCNLFSFVVFGRYVCESEYYYYESRSVLLLWFAAAKEKMRSLLFALLC